VEFRVACVFDHDFSKTGFSLTCRTLFPIIAIISFFSTRGLKVVFISHDFLSDCGVSRGGRPNDL
jgi:hypothetical protein